MKVNNVTNTIKQLLQDSIDVKQAVLADQVLLDNVADVAQRCIDTLKSGHKLLLAGNGGSASDAQHIAAELVGRFEVDRRGLPAIALTTNASQLTAISNDYGYEAVFSRQVEAFGAKGDLFVGLTTSGNSANVIAAAEVAKSQGLTIIGLTGASGGKLEHRGWGAQIRSYVLYDNRVKDHRTGVEANPVDILDRGKLDVFIDAELKRRRSSREGG
jgi:D-sedoheptulose 7-phosphate isomerase